MPADIPHTFTFEYASETLLAAADRTLYWAAHNVLFAADLHAGKATHLRLHGVPVPTGNMTGDLERLSRAIQRTGADRLIFLGDLFHSEHNSEWDEFAAWCQAQACRIELVRGNHDRFLTDEQLLAANIIVHRESYVLGPFSLRHHPLEILPDSEYVICGHVHPVQNVHGIGRDKLRLPCFWQQDQRLILPAFGSFTGGFDITREPRIRTICCAPDFKSLVALPSRI